MTERQTHTPACPFFSVSHSLPPGCEAGGWGCIYLNEFQAGPQGWAYGLQLMVILGDYQGGDYCQSPACPVPSSLKIGNGYIACRSVQLSSRLGATEDPVRVSYFYPIPDTYSFFLSLTPFLTPPRPPSHCGGRPGQSWLSLSCSTPSGSISCPAGWDSRCLSVEQRLLDALPQPLPNVPTTRNTFCAL